MGAGFPRRLRKRGGCGIFWIYGGCGMVIYFSGTGNSKYIADRIAGSLRSEERRVGKECRSRWSPYH